MYEDDHQHFIRNQESDSIRNTSQRDTGDKAKSRQPSMAAATPLSDAATTEQYSSRARARRPTRSGDRALINDEPEAVAQQGASSEAEA